MAPENDGRLNDPRSTPTTRRRSFPIRLAMVGILLLTGFLAVKYLRAPDLPRARKPRFQDEVELRTRPSSPPVAVFTKVTERAGIRFQHFTGARGKLWMPEMMGSGCAFLDFDNDGHQDLFFVNSSHLPLGSSQEPAPPTSALYRGRGDGTFEDVTAGSGLDVAQYGMGVAIGDYNGDNLVDVFVANLGPNRLFQNLGGGKFAEVTAEAGLGGRAEDWSTSSAFFDYDKDGDLDLFVCNYGHWTPELEAKFDFPARGPVGKAGLKSYLPPSNLPSVHCDLYQNAGDGTFRDMSAHAGIEVPWDASGRAAAQALGVRPFDFDGDGWLDLLVTNDLAPQFLFHNQRDGTFVQSGLTVGIAHDRMGQMISGMGVDVGYVGRQDALVVAISNISKMGNCMFVLEPEGSSFVDAAEALGIKGPTLPMTGFGLFFFDYDLDGRLDFFQTNGQVYTKEVADFEGVTFRQPNQLFWKNPPGENPEFTLVAPARGGAALSQEILGRGAAYGDIDGDGDLDIVVTENAGPAMVLRNDQTLGHHWLRIRLQGKPPNTSAIGAEARLRCDGKVMTRMVMPSRSYLSQVELPLTFGLGQAAKVDFVDIVWPDGSRQRVDNPGLDRSLTVVQGE